eukprot:TRINITY_DN33427_c0_g1_i1.p1 TRINITY_DN33427_c0_g1~~TRINITY_DN33427_c0_g1_i1.p1  ORF type:complete len:376 (-),score=63.50 TRINITY_DN33427_c0_g1_i1:302-1429(-)
MSQEGGYGRLPNIASTAIPERGHNDVSADSTGSAGLHPGTGGASFRGGWDGRDSNTGRVSERSPVAQALTMGALPDFDFDGGGMSDEEDTLGSLNSSHRWRRVQVGASHSMGDLPSMNLGASRGRNRRRNQLHRDLDKEIFQPGRRHNLVTTREGPDHREDDIFSTGFAGGPTSSARGSGSFMTETASSSDSSDSKFAERLTSSFAQYWDTSAAPPKHTSAQSASAERLGRVAARTNADCLQLRDIMGPVHRLVAAGEMEAANKMLVSLISSDIGSSRVRCGRAAFVEVLHDFANVPGHKDIPIVQECIRDAETMRRAPRHEKKIPSDTATMESILSVESLPCISAQSSIKLERVRRLADRSAPRPSSSSSARPS